MGLKSGSRDAELDDEQEESENDAQADGERTQTDDEKNQSSDTETDSSTTTAPDADAQPQEGDRPSLNTYPYKLRRSSVNEGREQMPFFLRPSVIEGEEDLQATLEDLLGEKVYKSDYREAAMVVAQQNPKLVAEVLRDWGYDLKDTR